MRVFSAAFAVDQVSAAIDVVIVDQVVSAVIFTVSTVVSIAIDAVNAVSAAIVAIDNVISLLSFLSCANAVVVVVILLLLLWLLARAAIMIIVVLLYFRRRREGEQFLKVLMYGSTSRLAGPALNVIQPPSCQTVQIHPSAKKDLFDNMQINPFSQTVLLP